jgi:hypothetical protein
VFVGMAIGVNIRVTGADVGEAVGIGTDVDKLVDVAKLTGLADWKAVWVTGLGGS